MPIRTLTRWFVAALVGCSVMPLSAQTPLQLQLVATGLERPVLMVSPPGDTSRLFVVEQPGRIRVVRDGVLLPTPLLDITTGFVVSYRNELGLFGLAFHPDFASNGHFYVYYTGFPWPMAYVRRFTVSAGNPDVADPASGLTVFNTQLVYGNHNAGMIAFGPDRMLYIAIGDGGSPAPAFPDDPQNHAQRPDSLLGKLLRIDVDHPAAGQAYGIPADNPFVGPGLPLDEIWASGLRNPWRFSFDRLTGDLYVGDVGGWNEEIDFQPAGAPGGRNYGWSCMSGTHCNGSLVCTCFAPNLTPPLHEYFSPPSHAVIGGFVYRGAAIPDLRGSYLFGDFVSRQIWSLRHDGTAVTQLVDRTAELTPPAGSAFAGILGFGQDAVGELYVGDLSGEVFKIAPVGNPLVGVAAYGTGTAGCAGPHAITAESSPVIGHPQFVVRTLGAPANGLGLCALASDEVLAGVDVGLGFLVHVDLASPFFVLLPQVATAAGVGRFGFGIPPSSTLVGLELRAQSLWLWPPQLCTPSPLGWSSSPGLRITLQP